MTTRSLSEWLLWLEQLHPKAIDLSLERIKPIAEILSLIHFSCPVITVAGTNGKGSTVTFLQKIAEAHGLRVAIYTSPHILQFNERIVIAGKPVSNTQIIQAFEVIESARHDISLTYFEFVTLASLWLFKQHQQELDLIILEVGMGGRLDAVNIVENDVAVITSIGLDHTEWLGETRAQIAFEKAGIFKEHGLAVCGDSDVPDIIFEQAKKLNTKLSVLKRDYDFFQDVNQGNDGQWSWQSKLQYWDGLPKTQLLGVNAATALMVFELLRSKISLSRDKVIEALKQATLMGRFQIISKQPQVIVDVAHNHDAVSILAKRLNETPFSGRTIAVFSMLKDKAIMDCLSEMTSIIDEWMVAPLQVARGSDIKQLKKAFFKVKIDMISWYQDIQCAFQAALSKSKTNDRIIVFGSFYTVANVMILSRGFKGGVTL